LLNYIVKIKIAKEILNMKSGFIKLYEELSQLNEAKQDTINFKN